MSASPDITLAEARRLYRWTSTLADTLVDIRRRFCGDLDQYLLYMTVVQAQADGALRTGGTPCGVNALSLAEACGLPRETARTKLRRMNQTGLLVAGEDGLLRASDAAAFHHEYSVLASISGPRP